MSAPAAAPAGAPPDSRLWLERLTGLVAGAVLLAVALGYSKSVYALYFTPRAVLIYPLAALFVLLWLIKDKPGLASLSFDWLDVIAGLFVVWLIVTTLVSPSRNLAWYGVLNRGGGAVMWITAAVLFVVARRALASRDALLSFALCGAGLLALGGVVTLLQLLGLKPPWAGVKSFLDQGRMTGTTGNPVNLAGLGLLTVWIGGLAVSRRDFGPNLQTVLAVCSVLGLACVIFPVSRAGYLAWGLGAVVILAGILLVRDWKRAGMLAGVIILVVAAVLLYNPRGEELVSGVAGVEQDGGAGSLSQSDQSRVEFWRIGMDAVKQRFLTGYGQGAYVVAYREHVSPETIISRPNVAVSDPHQVELLLASGSGIPGLALGLGFLLAPVALLAVRFAGRASRMVPATAPGASSRPAGTRPVDRSAPGAIHAAVGSGSRWSLPVLAGLAYAAAALAFLQVSPVDFVVLLPFALVSAGTIGLPSANGRLVRCLQLGTIGRFAWPVAAVAAAAVLILAVVLGARFYSADVAFAASIRGEGADKATEAHKLAPAVPEYAQVGGGTLWRQGVSDKNENQVSEAEAMLKQGLKADPQAITIFSELARLYSMTGRPDKAAAVCREGLRFSPHYPILQGLWGYAGSVAVQQTKDTELAEKIEADLMARPVDTPDGWHWLGELQGDLGDGAAAAASEEKAKALAPQLTAENYQSRLETGQ